MVTYEPFDWYEQALYYDLVFDEDTTREADFLEAVHEQYARTARRGRRALEPGCGSGRLVAALASRGWRVSGLDRSAGMLDFARRRLEERGLEASLRRGDMASFCCRARHDLAFCLVSTFKYLLDQQAAESHLCCVADALRPGGLYVLGLHTAQYEDRSRRRERWVVQRDGLEVVCTIQSWPADRRRRRERLRSRLTVREGATERRFETCWEFRTYSPAELGRLLRAAPALEHVATYDFTYDLARPTEIDGDQLDVVLVLRKR